MKIFITGGAGFIGRWLSSSLIEDGHNITIFDNLSNSSEKNLFGLVEKGLTFINGDITNYSQIEKSLINMDIVIHLAAQIDINDSIQNPEKTYLINVQGTKNLLEGCVKNNIQNIIAASSAAVYGHPDKLPLDENSPLNTISPYGESKVKTETLVHDYCLEHDLNGISLRFFNIYGKGQTSAYAGVITKFIECIDKNLPLTIFGDGTNTRDFIHINDVVDAIKSAMINISGKKGDVYNIATGKSISIKKLAELMLSISKKNLKIKFESMKKGDILKSETIVTKSKLELDFISNIQLENGLTDFFDF